MMNPMKIAKRIKMSCKKDHTNEQEKAVPDLSELAVNTSSGNRYQFKGQKSLSNYKQSPEDLPPSTHAHQKSSSLFSIAFDIISSVCLGLTCKAMYAIHWSLHSNVGIEYVSNPATFVQHLKPWMPVKYKYCRDEYAFITKEVYMEGDYVHPWLSCAEKEALWDS